MRREILSDPQANLTRLNQKNIVGRQVLQKLIISFLQTFCILFREVDHFLGSESLELGIFGPVLASIRVPIQSQLLNFKHRERFLLLLFVVNVDKDPLKVVIYHRIVEGVEHYSEIKDTVSPAETIFEAYMHIGKY